MRINPTGARQEDTTVRRKAEMPCLDVVLTGGSDEFRTQ